MAFSKFQWTTHFESKLSEDSTGYYAFTVSSAAVNHPMVRFSIRRYSFKPGSTRPQPTIEGVSLKARAMLWLMNVKELSSPLTTVGEYNDMYDLKVNSDIIGTARRRGHEIVVSSGNRKVALLTDEWIKLLKLKEIVQFACDMQGRTFGYQNPAQYDDMATTVLRRLFDAYNTVPLYNNFFLHGPDHALKQVFQTLCRLAGITDRAVGEALKRYDAVNRDGSIALNYISESEKCLFENVFRTFITAPMDL